MHSEIPLDLEFGSLFQAPYQSDATSPYLYIQRVPFVLTCIFTNVFSLFLGKLSIPPRSPCRLKRPSACTSLCTQVMSIFSLRTSRFSAPAQKTLSCLARAETNGCINNTHIAPQSNVFMRLRCMAFFFPFLNTGDKCARPKQGLFSRSRRNAAANFKRNFQFVFNSQTAFVCDLMKTQL